MLYERCNIYECVFVCAGVVVTKRNLSFLSSGVKIVCKKLVLWGKRKNWWELGLIEGFCGTRLSTLRSTLRTLTSSPHVLFLRVSSVYFQHCATLMWERTHQTRSESDTRVSQGLRGHQKRCVTASFCSSQVVRQWVWNMLLSRAPWFCLSAESLIKRPEVLTLFDTFLQCSAWQPTPVQNRLVWGTRHVFMCVVLRNKQQIRIWDFLKNFCEQKSGRSFIVSVLWWSGEEEVCVVFGRFQQHEWSRVWWGSGSQRAQWSRLKPKFLPVCFYWLYLLHP